MPIARRIGWFGADIWDAATSVVSDAFDVVPFSADLKDALTDVWEGPLRDFARTPLGVTVLTAVSSAAYGPLAYALGGPYGLANFGAQLATITWALPGLAKGDDLASAWTAEVIRRAEKTAEYAGGEAAEEITSELLPRATEWIGQLAPDELAAIQNAPAELLAEPVHALALEAGVDDWSIAMALSGVADAVPRPPDWGGLFTFDDDGRMLLVRVGWDYVVEQEGFRSTVSYAATEDVRPSWAKSAAELVPSLATPSPFGAFSFGASTAPPSDASVDRKRQGDVMLVVVIAAAAGTYWWWRKRARHA